MISNNWVKLIFLFWICGSLVSIFHSDIDGLGYALVATFLAGVGYLCVEGEIF
jgi:hypothetical protein